MLSLSPENLYRQILDSVDDLILLKGPESRIVWANSAFKKTLGFDNDDFYGQSTEPFSESDEVIRYRNAADRKVFETKSSVEIACHEVRTGSGETRFFNTVKTPIFDEAGYVAMSVGISRDITEKVKAEQELREQLTKLALTAKMSEVGEIAGSIVHEINNPLWVISMKADQLLSLLKNETTETNELKQLSSDILSAATRMTKVVKAMRSLSRNDTNDPLERVSFTELIDSTLALCEQRLRQRGIDIRIEGIDPSVFISAHPAQIQQVLLNLLNNSCDAIEPLAEKWICLSYEEWPGAHVLSVADSGAGIGQGEAEEIMKPFFTTKAPGKGTGLGLSISKRIIEAHEGRLLLDRAHPNTCFKLLFPKIN